MGFDEGRIIFERQDATFFTGDTVRGKLVFHQEKPKTFRGIYVKFKGYCNVHWTTNHTRSVSGPNNTRRTEHYTKQHNSHEEYFKYKHYLIGSDSGEYHLQPGNHEFPFELLIPQHCPSSYEGCYGQIRYELKCVVDRAMKFDQEKAVNLSVIATRDLNKDPYCKKPIPFEFRETYCCFCCKNGTCEVSVRLPAAGYCPGQTIPIEVSVDNQSNVEIEAIKLEIKEKTTFIAVHEPDRHKEKNVVAKIKKGPIDTNTSREWTLEMEVPVMDVRNVDACKYIDVDYEFEVTVCPEGCHSDSDQSARLVLGHIPLREFEDGPPKQEQFQGSNAPYVENNTSYPGGNQPYPDEQPPYPGAQPGYPGAQPGYPGAQPGYPGAQPGYPGAQPGYPGANPPPAGMGFQAPNSTYPGGNPPYPGGNQPYPGPNPPFPGANSPYPPYPGVNSPYPASYAASNDEKSTMPLLPQGAGVPYPPAPTFSMASAPEPYTPDTEGANRPPAYNPNYTDTEKKPDSSETEKKP